MTQRRSRPAPRAGAAGRPDRLALWAVILAVGAALAAAGSAQGQDSGGAPAPGAKSDYVTAELGFRGLEEGMQGSDVRTLQWILRAKRFAPLQVSGIYDAATVEAVKAFQRSIAVGADGIFSSELRGFLVGRMRARQATWYGPGFYGNRTACGHTLTPETLGVAHKTLPCGTPVTFYYGGRFLTVRVIDRGPFAGGYSWDLTEAAAKRIGMTQTDWVRSAHVRQGGAARNRRR